MNRQKEVLIPGARRGMIKEAVINLLTAAGIHQLPVALHQIAGKMEWGLVPYAVARQQGLRLVSTDGCTVARQTEGRREYIVLYNEAMDRRRIRWTIAHEFAHIALGHLDGQSEKKIFEAEANYFAKNLLAPVAVIAGRGITDKTSIARCCDISMEAAAIREADVARHTAFYARNGHTGWDKRLIAVFSPPDTETLPQKG